jgi:hypothetical protein
VDKRYEQYCIANPLFYDSPNRDDAAAKTFTIAQRPLPAGWTQGRVGDWMVSIRPGGDMLLQGWKIHVSACLDNAENLITRVWEYCVSRAISFKFLPGRQAVLLRNAKYAPRGFSGKAVTIYPADDDEFELTLKELDFVLAGEAGPYILSDLRYGDGPLYVRYGGFAERYCPDAHGDMVPAIENPAGELVPDLRSPVFAVPPWVSLPGFLEPHLAARNATTMAGLPWSIERALHFSNGGGVYVGTDQRTGERVVLKEGRPHAGLAADGSDAVSRLGREHRVLQRLSGLGIAPEVRGYFEVGGHHFLAEEFIDGTPLNSCYAERFPLLDADPDPARIESYTSWALRVCAGIERAVAAAHEQDVILNDLHMFNVIVRPDDTVVLIDFEAATHVCEGRRPTVGNPGFVAPSDRVGFDIDTYSIACMRLALFMPLTTLFAFDRGKAEHIAEVVAEHFPVPEAFLSLAVSEITRPAGKRRRSDQAMKARTTPSCYQNFGSGEQAWEFLRPALVKAVLASATPSRNDRLFPGDIEQFAAPGGGLGIAYGTAGVLYALSEAAGVRVPEYEEWLIAHAGRPARGTRLGLYDGLAGVAHVLWRLGYADAALSAADICLSDRWERLGSDLYGGLPGLSLSLLSLGDATGEAALLDAGLKAAEMVSHRTAHGAQTSREAAGLLHGAAGRALLFVRLYERTADPGYLDAAETALATDLGRCVTDRKGSLQVDDGWRVLPYLKGGSAGIGMVLDRFLAHRGNTAFAEAAAGIRLAACSSYYAQPGLFNGRAGMLLCLADGPGADGAGTDDKEQRIAAHVRRLAWHAVQYGDGLAFPGDMLLRMSMDLATGTAGVLFALAAALSPQGAALPFLGPAVTPASGGPCVHAPVASAPPAGGPRVHRDAGREPGLPGGTRNNPVRSSRRRRGLAAPAQPAGRI